MTDIVERLRTHHRWPVDAHHDALEAAEEIERLRNDLNVQYCGLKAMLAERDSEIERLRKHVEYVNKLNDDHVAEIERLRQQLSRHEWAESADRSLMKEEIEYLRNQVEQVARGF